ncbi:unnamed protein product [Rhizophagus irregularis]|nr:unnamed protein product [Rhizophagus irregularis]
MTVTVAIPTSDPTNFSKEDFNALKNSLQYCVPHIRFYNLTSEEFADEYPIKTEITDEIKNTYKFKLLLHGSRDGFTYKKFHEICDNQSRTVTIIKVKVSKEILGGYNPIEWKSDDSYGTTKDSFIFSFKRCNDIKSYILSRIKNEKVAILNSFDRGPSFGISDFILDGDFGKCGNFTYEKQISETTDLFSDLFSVEEYEVFQITR